MKKNRFKVVSAVHLFLINENKILLMRRYNTGYEDGNFSVSAGHLDGGESATDAIIREAKEELGINIKSENLIFAGVMHRAGEGGDIADERIDFFYYCDKWTGTVKNCEPNKCDQITWFKMFKIPNIRFHILKLRLIISQINKCTLSLAGKIAIKISFSFFSTI